MTGQYRIAVSLGSTQTKRWIQIETLLIRAGIRAEEIFFYERSRQHTHGGRIAETLSQIYGNATLIVVLHDGSYQKSRFTEFEFGEVPNRLLQQMPESIAVFRCDEAPLPATWGEDRAYERLGTSEEAATFILERLQRAEAKADGVHSSRLSDRPDSLREPFIALVHSRAKKARLERVAKILRAQLKAQANICETVELQDSGQLRALARRAVFTACYVDDGFLSVCPRKDLRQIFHTTQWIELSEAEWKPSNGLLRIKWTDDRSTAERILEILFAHQAANPESNVPHQVERHHPHASHLFLKRAPCSGRASAACERTQMSLALAYTLALGEQAGRLSMVRGLLEGMNLCARALVAPGASAGLVFDSPQVTLLSERAGKLLDMFQRGREIDGVRDEVRTHARRLAAYLNHHTHHRLGPAVERFCSAVAFCAEAARASDAVTADEAVRILVEKANDIHVRAVALKGPLEMASEAIFLERTVIRPGDHVPDDAHAYRWGVLSHIQKLHPQTTRGG